MSRTFSEIYQVTARFLPEHFPCPSPAELPNLLAQSPDIDSPYPFVADLAALEFAVHLAKTKSADKPHDVSALTIHPDLEILQVHWSSLPALLKGKAVEPRPRDGFLFILPPVHNREARIIEADDHNLLALKIVAESLDKTEIAEANNVSPGTIDNILHRAVDYGLLLAPSSKLVRPPELSQNSSSVADIPQSVEVFTLQWHLTQRCDLHCRHCYDRTPGPEIEKKNGLHVLDQLHQFSSDHNIRSQVTFTGGNPFLAPHFFDFYRAAVDRGFLTAILGNPVSSQLLETMTSIRTPEFFQVSLEGLPEHNDYIRGIGHFTRTIEFLAELKKAGIYSMVMLTLTKDNMDQVLPLAEILAGKVDLFTFNRLASMGEGAQLGPVGPEEYRNFLETYLEAAKKHPHLSLKDNFFNILKYERNQKLTGGCTGFGCGAAFNFVSLLANGDIHACRKMHSPIGNIYTESLNTIYHNESARQYRRGSSGCLGCPIRPGCGGCLAVCQGQGLDIFTDIDPYCFFKS